MTGKDLYDFFSSYSKAIMWVLVGVMSFIQIAPIKINPWTWLFKKLNHLFLRDVIDKVEDLSKEVKSLRVDFDEKNAINSRVRILRFADDISHGLKRSEESYKQVFDDISRYNNYCLEHPRFKNDMTVTSCEIIKSAYKKALEKRDFL